MNRRISDLSLVVWMIAATPILAAAQDNPPAPLRVLNLHASQEGLWVATTTGLLQLDANARFKRRWSTADGLPSDVVVRAVTTKDGSLWAATPYGAAQLQGERFVNRSTGLPSDDVTCLLAARGGLYAGTAHGLARWRNTQWEALLETHQFARDRTLAAIEAADGTLWFAKTHALTLVTPEGSEKLLIWRDPLNPDRAVTLPSTAVQAMAVDRNRHLWFASDSGLMILDGMQLLGHERWRPGAWGLGGLPGRRIWSIFAASNGDMWISFGDGLDHGFVAKRESVEGAWEPVEVVEGDGAVSAYTFAELNGTLWLGTSAGLYRLQGEKGFTPWPMP